MKLKLRVIVVTTRAALRHADSDPAHRTAIVDRGRALVDSVAAEHPGDGVEVSRALAELESLERG